MNEQVFMAQPPGFPDTKFPTHVCKLKKSIYGLKQALWACYIELTNFLLQTGFKWAISNASLFILHHSATPIYLIVYVDDIIVTGPDASFLNIFITRLANKFSLKDLGQLSYFLGVEVIPIANGLFLSQQKYIIDLLERMGMLEAEPSSTPLAVS